MLSIQKAEQLLSDNVKLLDGMNKYKQIMAVLYQTDVSTDMDFRRTFNRFFVMRSRTPLYYDKFYSFLEARKNVGATFEETLEELKSANGKLEVSFSSKLVHVIDPTQPIWDRNVSVLHFGMKVPGYGMPIAIRQKEVIKVYHDYCRRFYEYLESNEGQELIHLFDGKHPNSGLTDVKKLDFILWADV
ncbi:MAG: hypothetical protein LUI13_03365 [Lachnospiraceae bacterium]|nr:hypothetical protein [Lachnospiraceae bacterium]